MDGNEIQSKVVIRSIVLYVNSSNLSQLNQASYKEIKEGSSLAADLESFKTSSFWITPNLSTNSHKVIQSGYVKNIFFEKLFLVREA